MMAPSIWTEDFFDDFMRDFPFYDDRDMKRMEKKLLLYLIQNRNRLVKKEELFKEVWQESYVGEGTLNVHIRKIREKIENNPSKPEHIITEYGKGYIFLLKER